MTFRVWNDLTKDRFDGANNLRPLCVLKQIYSSFRTELLVVFFQSGAGVRVPPNRLNQTEISSPALDPSGWFESNIKPPPDWSQTE